MLLDGGFVRRRLELGPRDPRSDERRSRRIFPGAAQVLAHVAGLEADHRLRGLVRHRIYCYDSPPLAGVQRNPIDGGTFDFARHPEYEQNKQLQGDLAQAPDVAVRRGELKFRGWRVRASSMREVTAVPRLLAAGDLVPDVEQKGVDLRIGIDIALLALRRVVNIVVLVTGDSDLVPAMKLARREGLKVYLDTMGHNVARSFTEHADYVFPPAPLVLTL